MIKYRFHIHHRDVFDGSIVIGTLPFATTESRFSLASALERGQRFAKMPSLRLELDMQLDAYNNLPHDSPARSIAHANIMEIVQQIVKL